MCMEKSTINNVDFYFMNLFIANKKIFSITENNKIMIILNNNEIITLLNSKFKISDFTKENPTYWYANYIFSVKKAKLELLKKHKIKKFRIYFDKGYRDYSKIKSNKMKKIFNCVE